MKSAGISTVLLLCSILATPPSFGEESESELAADAQNPIADLISVRIENITNFGLTPDNKIQNVLTVQPFWPFHLNENWNLITRTILPIVSQPALTPGESRTNGLGDTTLQLFFSPSKPGKVSWGLGPVLLFPTATAKELGNDKFGVGPTGVVLATPGNWVLGSLFTNITSVAGAGSQDVNTFFWQYFINYNLPNGWYLSSIPVITANWEADSKNRWTVPFGGGVGKVFHIGKQAINARVQAFGFVERPSNGTDWQLLFQWQWLFPK